jgi:hypothetical protein
MEARNRNMQQKTKEFNAQGKENWENFKKEFNRDMEELGTALKNLGTTKNE